MADKIIDFDPSLRLSKEGLNIIQDLVKNLTVNETRSITIIYTPEDGGTQVHAFGMDFGSIAVAQTLLSLMSQEMIKDEFEFRSSDDE